MPPSHLDPVQLGLDLDPSERSTRLAWVELRQRVHRQLRWGAWDRPEKHRGQADEIRSPLLNDDVEG